MISVRQQADTFPAPNLLSKESFHIERLFVFQHKVYGSGELVSENAQGFSFVVFALQFVHKIFCLAESLSIRIAASLIAHFR